MGKSLWFRTFSKNNNATCRIICFPYGGGGASAFRNWHRKLPSFVEVVCAQYPGRESRIREPLIRDLDIILEELTLAIVDYANMPYVLFGHSVGGYIAHHLTHTLYENNKPLPELLIVSGRSAPTDSTEYYRKITHLPDAEFLEALKEYDGTPEEIVEHSELMAIYLPILRADFSLSDSRVNNIGKVPCPISVFGGSYDKAPKSHLMLWQNETSSNCNVTMFPGGHFFLKEREDLVLQKITELLTKNSTHRAKVMAY